MMRDREEIFRMVATYLIKDFEVPEDEIGLEANLFTDLGLDSIDALDWFAKMEATIHLPIVEEDLKKVRTVRHVVDYLMRHLRDDA